MKTPKLFFLRTRAFLAGATILAGVLLNGSACGQNLNKMVGIKAGAITTGVDSEVEAFLNTDWRTGISAGGFVSIDPSPKLTLRANLLYSQRGFGFRMNEEGAGLISGDVKVRSFEVQMSGRSEGLWSRAWSFTVGLGWPF